MYLFTAAEMRKLDARAVEMGIPALVLMENAGRAVAHEAAALLQGSSVTTGAPAQVGILAGPGQNGGDGLCAARHLSSMGFDVKVALFGTADRLPPEARANCEALRAYPVEVLELGTSRGAELDSALSSLEGVRVIVDALLGTGQKGSPRPPMDSAVNWANRQQDKGIPIVACDVPTGLDSDTGSPSDPTIRASVTVTMGRPKVGLYSYPGRMYAGRVVVEPLGLPLGLLQEKSSTRAVFIGDAKKIMPLRLADHHKGRSGHVTVAAGSLGMAGAAALSAEAALRAGAGTVTLVCPGRVYQVCASMVPEVMVVPCGSGSAFSEDEECLRPVLDLLGRSACLVVGPGLGRGHGQEAFVDALLKAASSAGVPCLIDADGLHAVAGLGGLSYLSGLGGKFILTPHPGELSRLVGADVRTIGQDRVNCARRAALESKSVVCLKGAGTCVANEAGEVVINTSGDPAMATAGSGDVLSGVVAALVSQGLPPFDAAWLGVFWHGLAGELAKRTFGSHGILAGDISRALPAARGAIEGGEGPHLGPERCPD